MLDFIQNDSRSLLTIEENKLIIENYRLTINELLKLNNKVVLSPYSRGRLACSKKIIQQISKKYFWNKQVL